MKYIGRFLVWVWVAWVAVLSVLCADPDLILNNTEDPYRPWARFLARIKKKLIRKK